MGRRSLTHSELSEDNCSPINGRLASKRPSDRAFCACNVGMGELSTSLLPGDFEIMERHSRYQR